MKYFSSCKIFEQLELALTTEFALNFSSGGAAAPLPPALYATDLSNLFFKNRNPHRHCVATRLESVPCSDRIVEILILRPL